MHPRLGGIPLLRRFGLTLNHRVHLHACVTDGVFRPIADASLAFLPARPITQADEAALTERVRRLSKRRDTMTERHAAG